MSLEKQTVSIHCERLVYLTLLEESGNISLLQCDQHGLVRVGADGSNFTVGAASKSTNFTVAESKYSHFTVRAESTYCNFTEEAESKSIYFTAVAACTFPIGARCFLPLPTTRPATRRCRRRQELPASRSWPGLRYGFRFLNKIVMCFRQSRVFCALIAN